MSSDQYGSYQGFAVPPMPTAPPPAPPDGLRSAVVGLLNLSGLGLGYALTRRWLLMAACWVATIVLLLVALPADPDGVSGVLVTLYVVFLVFAAVHGALVGLRTRIAWTAPLPLALVLALVLLAVPAGGVVLYDNARDEATEQMLLDRLETADQLVAENGTLPFSTAEPRYRQALAVYDDLSTAHSGSRAAGKVPDRLKTFYTTVAGAYTQKNYCDAIPQLKYLRTVPGTIGKKQLGTLTTWPDDRLATSLYECASTALGTRSADWPTNFGYLLTAFPQSSQAKQVEPAVKSAVDKTAQGVRGSEPCAAVEQLTSLSGQIGSLQGEQAGVADALGADARRADSQAAAGTYQCGVSQYKDADFDSALTTMNDFVKDNPHDKNRTLAKKIAIAAEVAQTVPAAGKKLPTTASGGSISVTVKNDSPDDITVLYTGPVTGSFSLKGCGSCTTYSLTTTLLSGFKPCSSGKNYPQKTISLPTGTTYFVHRPDSSSATPASDTAKLRSGYIYTECAYSTGAFGTG
ncbi:hypothetical protein OG223_03920 [Streptomyces sp. NBC_01478]|uniref:hypothetical protein n=1 Tax=Streptomyces sp. NBC_01478 TaxID=2903882 RepID=UPI002E335920|nr:hypothetical protein [Streptomyces sp. NBC_01478]